MPIYEYACGACGHRLEALQKMSDQPLRECPACRAPALSKLVSAASFRLKGGGWYETDFKTGNRKHGTQAGEGSGTGNADATSAAAKEVKKDTRTESASSASTPASPAPG